jgi:TPR repeat protein
MADWVTTHSGDGESAFYLATIFSGTDYGRPQRERAWELYQQSASLDFPPALATVGEIYMLGPGLSKFAVPEDDAKAMQFLNRAIAANDPEGFRAMGDAYFLGHGVAVDASKADEQLRKSIDLGNNVGYLSLAGLLAKKGDLIDAVEMYRKAADAGVPTALWIMADCYEKGLGVAKDEQQAFAWLTKAAGAGYPDAEEKLGEYYADTRSSHADPKLSAQWYQKAADHCQAKAEYTIALMYWRGSDGFPYNRATGLGWLVQAAGDGNADAQTMLGQCYLAGLVVPPDKNQAKYWLQEAAEAGSVDASMQIKLMNDPAVPDYPAP